MADDKQIDEAVNQINELKSKTSGREIKGSGVKRRARGKCVFPSSSSSVKDNKDHFPITSAAQARSALSRVAAFDKAPEWYKGSVSSLKNAVRKAVKSAYPSIDVSESTIQNKEDEVKTNEKSIDLAINNLLGDKPVQEAGSLKKANAVLDKINAFVKKFDDTVGDSEDDSVIDTAGEQLTSDLESLPEYVDSIEATEFGPDAHEQFKNIVAKLGGFIWEDEYHPDILWIFSIPK